MTSRSRAIAGSVFIAQHRPAAAQALVPPHVGCVLGESYSSAHYQTLSHGFAATEMFYPGLD